MGEATRNPLLMIPGPVELSPAVAERCAMAPPSHLAPEFVEAFGRSLERMREVWLADAQSQPFVVSGSGTTAMEMAVANLVEPGDRALLVSTGYFSDRLAEMLRRAGARLSVVSAEPGDAPPETAVARALEPGGFRAVFATHVDTSTGVRVEPAPVVRLAREHDALSVFDGVCATGAEHFEMAAWDADVYLTASQKALGLPPGLALLVASRRALERRAARRSGPPPLVLDWNEWQPVMQAYEQRRPAYFATPATSLVLGLETALGELLEEGIERRVDRHRRAATALRAGFRELGLRSVPRDELQANTLTALRYPEGIAGSALLARIRQRGVVVAGGLHPALREASFRVGHMGYAVQRSEWLRQTASAIGAALSDLGYSCRPDRADAAVAAALDTARCEG